jgi:hypothetical protein
VLGRFSVRRVQKHHENVFAKSPCKKICTFHVSFSSIFYFIAFAGVSQRREFKSATKNLLQKVRFKNVLQNNRPKKSKTDSPPDFLISFLGIAQRGEFENTTKNIQKHLALSLFFL